MRFTILALLFLTCVAAADTLYTSRDFQHDIATHPKIIFYFVSEGMPLSIPGLKNTLEVAKNLGYKVQALNDPVEPIPSSGGLDIPIAVPAAYTRAAGVPLHFPILLVFKNGQACGSAIPGYKSLKGYQEIISRYDQQCESQATLNTIPSQLAVNSFHTANILQETSVPRENIAYYFKPIDNDWVTYHAAKQVYFFNRKTGIEFIVPGQYDCVATPDAQFATLPAPLRFFSLAKIWTDPNNAVNLLPDFSDPSMKDEYQSIGIVSDSPNRRSYRVTTAWSTAVSFRDYSLNKTTGEIELQEQPKTVCRGYSLSLPMISKNGLMLGGHSNGEGFTKIVSIGAAGTDCKLIEDLGFKTGKVAFSHDGNQIAFVRKEGDAINAYVYQLKTKSLTLLLNASEIKGEYLVFPDFLPNGNVIVMKVQKNANGSAHSTLFEMRIEPVT